MIDNTLTQAAVTLLRQAQIDGETMEWIIDELGVREQVSQQLQVINVQRMIDALLPTTAVANANSNTSIAYIDIETLADDIASNIARNSDTYVDHSNIELSIDYDRHVSVDSIGLEETELAATITESLAKWLRERQIHVDEE
jgi:hypothetical protein